MKELNNKHDHHEIVSKSLEVTIKVGLVLGLLAWCFIILKPFLMIILWGMIIAITIYPLYKWLRRILGNRRKLASVIVTLLMLLVILTPIVMLGSSLGEAVKWIKTTIEAKQSIIPPPPQSVQNWALIGPTLYDTWDHASQNLAGLAKEYSTQLMDGLTWLLKTLSSAGFGLLMFLVSIIISGIFLVFSEQAVKGTFLVAERLLGKLGDPTMKNAETTIRNVARGILGVAFIQSVIAGIGFLIGGVPGAGLWALIGFFLCIVQIGLLPVVLPVLIWVFFKETTTNFIIVLLFSIVALVIDNVLKPLLLGRGSPAPMLVVFLGAIGGFISFGLIGLFVGAVVLSLGYNLCLLWLRADTEEAK